MAQRPKAFRIWRPTKLHLPRATNWRLVDKNGRVTPIDTTLGPGQSVLVALDGSGVQLGNQGGNLILHDNNNAQIDVVTYTSHPSHLVEINHRDRPSTWHLDCGQIWWKEALAT